MWWLPVRQISVLQGMSYASPLVGLFLEHDSTRDVATGFISNYVPIEHYFYFGSSLLQSSIEVTT